MFQTPEATSTPHVAMPPRKALGQFGWVWGLSELPSLSLSAGGHVWDVQLSTQPLPSILLPVRARGCCGPPDMSQQDSGVRGEQSGGSPLCTGTCLLTACHAKGLPIPSFAPGTVCTYPFVGICTWAVATKGPSWGLMHGESSPCGHSADPCPSSSPGGSLSSCSALHVPSPWCGPACHQPQQDH